MADLKANISLSGDIKQFTFNAIDYMVFGLMLTISAAIGVYFGFFSKGDNTTEEYLHGSKQMKTLPIAISLVASQLSGFSFMAIPAELYSFGINWAFNILSMLIVVPLLCWVVIPVFYNNGISNCYEYLQLRFSRKTRELLTMTFIIKYLFLLPIYMFIPSLAFSQVTGVNIHLINSICCSICVFYTMFGGIKAVVWTDVVQAAIMVTSVMLVGILGVKKVGGFAEVIRIASEGGRLTIDYTFDTTTRITFWNCFISSILLWASYVGLNQSCVQRIVSLPTLKHARRSLILFGIGFAIIMFFNCLCGIVMYARYHNCDPVTAGFVSKADKIMPYFVQDVVGQLKGMPGIFISCVFSAALSTMSAYMNSLAGIIYCDYIKPRVVHTERRANIIMKCIVLCFGIHCILAGTLVEKFTSILQIVYSIIGVTYGAVFGVFLMGMLIPKAHAKAAIYAVVFSILIMVFIATAAQKRLHYKTLHNSVENCQDTYKMVNQTDTFEQLPESNIEIVKDKGFNILDISFNWYIVFGVFIVFAIGIPFSYILSPENHRKLDVKLLAPFIQPLVNYELVRVDDEITESKKMSEFPLKS